ncbi:LuxR C-terminal-related transcriptional regulator [Streptomyces sp. NPDC057245]|uniref:helix-turn-helix transcriptional regulator n=1 Tax=Streptomyces TaxID=1883 RepID=UPI0027E4536E|nr:LuxR C-terminal-related transcriptional regulator [Streptomyces sp. A108]
MLSQLRGHPEIEVHEESGPGSGTVDIFVCGTLDASALTRLRRVVPDEGACVVLVVNALPEARLLDVVERGIDVVVWRHDATGDRLVQAVLAAADGRAHLPADLLGSGISQASRLFRNAAATTDLPSTVLTPRERDVLRLVAEGYGTNEIAAELFCSRNAVRSVMGAVTRRLRLRNKEHAVAYAVREGYI